MRFVIVALFLVGGCAGDGRGNGNGNNPGVDGGGPGPGDPDMAMAPKPMYPAGPYGHQKGDTLAELSLQGYRLTPAQTDSNQLQWDTTIKLSDYFTPSCKCLLITIGALWCPACQDEQPQLVMDVAGDPGFCVLGIVQEGQTQQVPATMADVGTWAQSFHQNFSVVQGTGATDHLLSGFGPTIGLPFSFVVQPKTMKVLDVVQGFDPMIHTNAMALCNQ